MKIIFLSALFATVLLSSCSSDDEPNTEVENQEEVITNFTVTLTGGDQTITLEAIDADGDEEIDVDGLIGGTLKANTSYTGSIILTNQIEDEDITAEVKEEDDEHQFFFTPISDLDVVVSYDDEDDNGNPVGLIFKLETGEASSGELQIQLIHQPNKTAEGVSAGESTNAGGETDFFIEFPITIEPVPLNVEVAN